MVPMTHRVALVKSPGRADAYAAAIRDAGFTPVLVSPFREEPVDPDPQALAAALATAERGGWIAVTSPHAVPALQRWAKGSGLGGARFAAVGQGTAGALHSAGFRTVVVGDAGGAALARKMIEAGLARGDVVLHPCGFDARAELAEALGDVGVRVVAVAVYRMVADPVGERAVEGTFAAVIVGSPRLAQRAAELFRPPRPPVVAIGRTTASALRDAGWTPAAVAASPTPADVAAALRAVRPGQ